MVPSPTPNKNFSWTAYRSNSVLARMVCPFSKYESFSWTTWVPDLVGCYELEGGILSEGAGKPSLSNLNYKFMRIFHIRGHLDIHSRMGIEGQIQLFH